MRIRIGIRGAGELDLDVEDPESVVAAFHAASDEGVFEVAEADGSKTTVVAEHVVYLRVDAPEGRSVGFSE